MPEVKMLWAHRKERYPGEHGYEVLAAVDEYTDDVNPEWFPAECERAVKACGDDLVATAVVRIYISHEDLKDALYRLQG